MSLLLSLEESAETKNLYQALLAFAAEAEPVMKSAENPHFKSSYADLSEVFRVARPAMQKAGLVLTQAMAFGEAGAIYCVSKLIHAKSGEWVRSYHPLTPQRSDSQGIGSAYTYARRYSAMAILGLAPEDDDGEASQGRDTRPVKKELPVVAPPTQADIEKMVAAFANAGVGDDELAEMIGGPLAGINAVKFAWLKQEYKNRVSSALRGSTRKGEKQ